jgi:Domain of unknown function (DUF4157)
VDDPLEHQADRVSEQVTRMPDSDLSLGDRPSQVSFKPADGGEGRKLREREVPRKVGEALASPGRPLDATTRAYFEPRLRHDFSRVRVHANEVAARSARDVNAKAYTVGHNIVFGAGQFAAETTDGRRLLGHELAHVVQQSGADATSASQSGGSRSPAYGSSSAARGLAPVIRSPSSGFLLQRQPEGLSGTKQLEPLEVVADRIARLALGEHQAEIQNALGSKRGPVISVVRDELSHEIFVGLNNHIPAKLAVSVKTSIESHQARIAAGELVVVRTDPDAAVGGHSEVIALNRAIRAREARMAAVGIDRPMTEQERKVFELQNVWLTESRRFEVSPRCEHCADITRGVSVTKAQFLAEGGKSGEITVPQRGSVTPSGGTPKAVTSAAGEIGSEERDKSGRGTGPEFVPSALRFGEVVAEGVIVGLITDYIAGKIQEHFKRSAFEDHLRDLQPEIDEEKERAIERVPPEIRQLIRHPVVDIFGNRSRQFYWVVQLRIRTEHATGTRFAISGTIPELESVTISEKESSRVGSLHEGKPNVAPARHAVILREDSRTVIYSEPIASWEVVYKDLSPREMDRAGSQFKHSEAR